MSNPVEEGIEYSRKYGESLLRGYRQVTEALAESWWQVAKAGVIDRWKESTKTESGLTIARMGLWRPDAKPEPYYKLSPWNRIASMNGLVIALQRDLTQDRITDPTTGYPCVFEENQSWNWVIALKRENFKSGLTYVDLFVFSETQAQYIPQQNPTIEYAVLKSANELMDR